MKLDQPRHATDPTRTAADRTEYMRDYMAHRRCSRSLATRISHVCATSVYDIGRHELRDGSDLMWPDRVMNSETPMSDGDRDIAAAEKRRRAAPAAPIKVPTPRPKIGPGRRAFEKSQPWRENHA
jgi:hypothetical protein